MNAEKINLLGEKLNNILKDTYTHTVQVGTNTIFFSTTLS